MVTDPDRAESAELGKRLKLEQNRSGFPQVLLFKTDDKVGPEGEQVTKDGMPTQ